MILQIKLYGHLICNNPALPYYNQKEFNIELPACTTLFEIQQLLKLGEHSNFVSIVNGVAKPLDYMVDKNCNISFFLPMADRQHNFFDKILRRPEK